MNLYLRLFYMLIASFFKPRIAHALEETSLNFCVLPSDLDLNGHMNNGRYLTLMDIGRMDFVMRFGMAGYVIRNGYIPVLSSASMRYRLPLLPFQKYRLTTRIAAWDDRWAFMEHRFIIVGDKKDGAVAAIGLVKGGFFNKATRATVSTRAVMKALGIDEESPALPPYMARWQEAEDALREDMKNAA